MLLGHNQALEGYKTSILLKEKMSADRSDPDMIELLLCHDQAGVKDIFGMVSASIAQSNELAEDVKEHNSVDRHVRILVK